MTPMATLLNADENDERDIPWWVRASYRYGLSMVISLGLTIFLAWMVMSDLSAMRREHQELGFYLRAICFNTASTESQRAGCYTGRGQ